MYVYVLDYCTNAQCKFDVDLIVCLCVKRKRKDMDIDADIDKPGMCGLSFFTALGITAFNPYLTCGSAGARRHRWN